MEGYELDPDKILNWGSQYASYEDLEATAKALYGIYAVRRKKDHKEAHIAAKKLRKKYKKQGWKQ